VLDTLVESAVRLCGAEMANIWRPRDGGYRHTASYGVTARYKEYLENKEFLNTVVIEPSRGTTVGRVLLERRTVHIHDIQADPDYKLSGLVALGGTRTMLGVPILRQGEPIGVLVLVQSEVRPFTDKQIELATTFADQAAIAIENARLLKELRERTDQVEAQSQEVAKLKSAARTTRRRSGERNRTYEPTAALLLRKSPISSSPLGRKSNSKAIAER
jgi:two-component system, NtrC family, sensor kinase